MNTLTADLLRKTLSAATSPAFLAGIGKHDGNQIVLHVKRGFDRRKVAASATALLARAGIHGEVVVRSHRLRDLAFPKTLERWLAQFGVEHAAYDPTLAFGRAQALVSLARSCRMLLGPNARGFFFDHANRALYVLVRDSDQAFADDRLAECIREGVGRFETGHDGGPASDAELTVRVTTQLPRAGLVAVDDASARLAPAARKLNRHLLTTLWAALALIGVASTPALARPEATTRPAFFKGSARNDARKGVETFGVLPGLSVFGDGKGGDSVFNFAGKGLGLFFDETNQAALSRHEELAQNTGPGPRIRIRPNKGLNDEDPSGFKDHNDSPGS